MTARLSLTGRGRNTKPPLKKESHTVDMQVKFPVAATLSPQPISIDVLAEKYLADGESTIEDLYRRVARALAAVEKPEDRLRWEDVFYRNMLAGGIGAGRIMAAAGLDTKATLINCFVQPVADATNGFDEHGNPGIYTALAQAAETMRRGGGVGYDFSALRPKGSLVKGTNSMASGPCSFIDVFDASCTTVESAGARRGAQMGVMRIDHPDVLDFITAKRQKGRWNNFNVSVGVTDAFMHAVENDKPWALTHKATPSEAQIAAGAFQRDDGVWVYRAVQARELWGSIMKSTYDFAEPGILFLDNINNDNNLQYCESISATNPCVPGDTPILTSDGYVNIGDVIGKEVSVWNGKEFSSVTPFATGFNSTVRVELSNGVSFRCTPAHQFILHGDRYNQEGARKTASNLAIGDKLAKYSMPIVDGGESYGSDREAYSQGFYSGDGTTGQASSLIYEPKYVCAERLLGRIGEETTQPGRRPWYHGEMRSKSWVPLAGDLAYCLNWLAGLLDSDGTVCTDREGGQSFQITSVDKSFLDGVRLMLTRLGVQAKVAIGSVACSREMPDGSGGKKTYECKDCWRLVICGFDAWTLMSKLGMKLSRLKYECGKPQRSAARFVTVTAVVPDEPCETFCFTELKNHTGTFYGVVSGQCGEQPLPPYGCCDLGPVILTKFVRDPFTDDAFFDAESFRNCVAVQVRMLDNVLDATVWPLPEQQREAQAKRRIGVGFTGLGDTLIMLGFKYNSEDGRAMAQFIASDMREAAYKASVDLAKERGAFPLFEADAYLASGFASRLPSWLQDDIRAHGIRNSHLLSIAPTGTVSLAFADNASNGIEPAFSWTYDRKKRTAGGGSAHYAVEDHAYRLYRAMFGADAALPDTFVSALEMSAEDHIAMMETVQPFIDTAISKTVNVPADYPFEDFQKLYMQSWRAGLKGCATYRPNDTLGAVLSVTPAAAPVAATPVNSVIGRRPEGPLNAIVDKIEYFAHDGARRIYLVVSFMMVDGVERPMEFFMPVGQTGESQQWITGTMRSLSLAARGGFLDKALDDLRKVAWDRGSIRYGFKVKDDGTRVPLWHDSEVALLAYAIQETIANRGTGKADAPAPVHAVAAAISASPAVSGSKCPECGARAVIKKDGCSFCTECGHLGSCG